jgi:hypothetical protein
VRSGGAYSVIRVHVYVSGSLTSVRFLSPPPAPPAPPRAHPHSLEAAALGWQWLEWGESTLAPKLTPIFFGVLRKVNGMHGIQLHV